MESASRHSCLIYEGPPSKQLPALVAVARERLEQNHRCLYLNSPPMVAGMRSYLAASGIDVAEETARGSLVLTSDQEHLLHGYEFDPQHLIDGLRSALDRALDDGYSGLWASGDMVWEVGPQNDFSKLLEYEWRLEEFLQSNPQMGGICQYRADMLPRKTVRHGLVSHSTIFVNETLSVIDTRYLHPKHFSNEAFDDPELDGFVNQLISQQTAN
jgi:hypothetical protein